MHPINVNCNDLSATHGPRSKSGLAKPSVGHGVASSPKAEYLGMGRSSTTLGSVNRKLNQSL